MAQLIGHIDKSALQRLHAVAASGERRRSRATIELELTRTTSTKAATAGAWPSSASISRPSTASSATISPWMAASWRCGSM